MTGRGVRGALVMALVGLSGLARAEPQPVSVDLQREQDRVVAELDLSSAFTQTFRARVEGGLESRVEIFTELRDRYGEVIGRGARSCKLLYSLWDERIYVSVQDDGRDDPQLSTFEEIAPALSACGRMRSFPVGLSTALALAGGYQLYVRMIMNPVSEELVKRSRQFVANPRGGGRGGSNAVLGTIAGLFSRERGALGETLDFESGTLSRPDADRIAPTPSPPSLAGPTGLGAVTATAGGEERRAR